MPLAVSPSSTFSTDRLRTVPHITIMSSGHPIGHAGQSTTPFGLKSMILSLHQRSTLFRHLFILGLFCLGLFGMPSAKANHIMGGEMTYLYIGTSGTNLQYSVSMNVYADRNGAGWNLSNPANPASGNPVQIDFSAYSADNNSKLLDQSFQSPGGGTTIQFANPELPSNCAGLTCLNGFVITRSSVTFTVTLPFTFNGYYFLYGNRTRNAAVTNLQNPTSLGMSMYQAVPGPQYANSSPQFTDNAIPTIFINDTSYFVNSAFDPDGDRLVYSFTPALNATGNNNPATWAVPANCNYNPNYSFSDPLGPNGTSTIDASTGLTKYFATNSGAYVCAIAIQEFRRLSNGTEIQIGTTRRELQLLVVSTGSLPGQCPVNQTPVQAGSYPTNINITQGQSVSFNVLYRDPDLNIVTLSGTGNILSGANGYNGPRASFNPLNGTVARGTFTWNTTCAVPANTYSIVITAKDDGCPPKTIVQTVNINVSRFTGPTLITGAANPCSGVVNNYVVSGSTTGITRLWKVTGGTIVGQSFLKDTVKVNWTSPTGTVRLVSTSSAGCKDSVSFNVNTAVVNPVIAGANRTICATSSTTLTASGGNGTFVWTTLAGASVGTGSSLSVRPTTTTSYVVSSTSGSCAARDTLVVTVIPKATAGADITSCGNFSGQVGTAAISGTTYSWTSSPAGVTFVDPVTTANPRISITNNGTYQLIVTATNVANACASRDTINVTVVARPREPRFADSTICSGATVVIGPATAETGVTYLWGNTTGFSSPVNTAANPVVTLNNTRSTTLVVKYPVTATNTTTGCTRTDTVTLRVRPVINPTFNPSVSVCTGESVVIGPTATAGLTYSWSPATFLSATNVANPTFTDPTASVGVVVRPYTLTIRDASGCQISRNLFVSVNPGPVLTKARDITICNNAIGSIGSNVPTNGVVYSWAPTTGLTSPTAPTTNIRLITAGASAQVLQYILTATNNASGCISRDTVLVTLQPLTVANAGADRTTCSNVATTLGATSLPNHTYIWTPTTNLTGANSAQPVFLGTNNTASPIVTRYIVTVINSATVCASQDTVFVTLNGTSGGQRLSTTFCSGAVTTVGPAASAGFTYSWTPTALFTNPNVAQPTLVSNTNTGTTPLVLTAFRTATNATSGCSSQDTLTITINPLPTANAGADIAICNNLVGTIGSPGGTPAGVTYSWSPTTGLANPNATQTTISLANAGATPQVLKYILTVTNTVTGCQNKDSVLVTLQPLTVADAGADRTTCSNGSTTLGVATLPNYTYSWSPVTNLTGATTAQPVFQAINNTASPIVTRYIVNVTNSVTGCVAQDSVFVTVNGIAGGQSLTTNFCSGAVTTVGQAASAGFTYSWTPTALFTNPNVAQPTLVSNTNAGTNPLVVTAFRTATNTSSGCSSQDTLTITINPLPVSSAGADIAICNDVIGTIGAPANGSGFTYSWSPTTGLTSPTAAQSTIVLTSAGNNPQLLQYILTTTATATGCSKNDTVVVTLRPKSVADAGQDKTTCSNVSTTIGTATLPNYTYSWSPTTNLTGATTAQPIFLGTNTTATPIVTRYIVTATNGTTGCTSQDTVFVTLNGASVGLKLTDTFCSGATSIVGTAGTAGFTYGWTPTTLFVDPAVAQPTLVSNTNTGINPLVITAFRTATNTATGCTSQDTLTITINPLPVAAAGADIAICSGAIGQLGAAGIANRTYSWSPVTGLSSATVANPTVTLTNPTSLPTVNQYILTTTNTTTSCTKNDTVLVTVNPSVSLLPLTRDSVCSQASLVIGTPAATGVSYVWSPTTGLSGATLANPTLTLTNSTTAPTFNTYIRTTTNISSGCAINDTFIIKVNPLPVVALGPDQVICSDQTATLGFVPETNTNYNWSLVGGLTTGLTGGLTIVGPGQATATFGNAGQTVLTQRVRALGTSSITGCTKADTVLITVNPLPLVNASTPDTLVICANGSTTLGVAPTAGLTYSWSPATGLSSANVANPTVTLTNNTQLATKAKYVLTVTNIATGCVSTDSAWVRVNPLPIVTLGTADSLCSRQTISIGAPAVVGFSYRWSPATGLSDVTAANPSLTLVNNTQSVVLSPYKLVVTNTTTGCKDSATLTVRVNPLPIANAGRDTATCSNGVFVRGESPAAGFSYIWSRVSNPSGASFIVSDTLIANPTFRIVNIGTQQVTAVFRVTKTNLTTGCANSDTINLTSYPSPAAIAFATDTATTCSGIAVNLGQAPAFGVTYSWSPATGLSNAAVANPTVLRSITSQATQTFMYRLTATNPVTGCVSRDSVILKVLPLPEVTLAPDYTTCSGSAVALGQAAVAGFNYVWSGTTFLSNVNAAQPTYTRVLTNGAAQTSEVLTLTVTNAASNCVAIFTTTVKTNSNPVSNAGANATICSDDTATIGAAASAGFSYQWLTAAGVVNPAAAQTKVTRNNTSGIQRFDTLVVRTTDLVTLCSSTDTTILTVNPRPASSNIVFGSNTVCPDVTGQIYSVPNQPNTTYNWTIGGGTIIAGQGTNEITVNWGGNNPNAFVQVAPTNIFNCPGDTQTLAVLIKILLKPSLPVGDTIVCSASPRVTYTTGANVGSVYTWFWSYDSLGVTYVRNSAPTTNTYDIAWTGLGKGKVWVFERSITASNTCEGYSDTTRIEVFPSPDSTKTITGPAAVCERTTSIPFSILPTLGATYRWAVVGKLANSGDTIMTGQGTNAITVNAAKADTLVISVTETSVKGCVGKTIKDTLIINVLPTVLVGTVDSVCSGQPLVIGAPAVANYAYVWSPATGLSNVTAANPTLTLTQVGSPANYKYYLTVTNTLTGCKRTDSIKIRVNPLPIALAGADQVLCSGASTTLGAARIARVSYRWSPVGGIATGLVGGLTPTDTLVAQPAVKLQNATNTPIWQRFALLVADSVTRCVNYDTVAIRVNPLPIAQAFGADTVKLCSAVPTLIGGPAVDSLRYQWSTVPALAITGLNDDTLANPTLTVTQVGSALPRTFVLTVTNRRSGCVNTDTVVAVVSPLPVITRNPLDSICSTDSKELVVGIESNVRVTWSPAAGLNRVDSTHVIVSLANTTALPFIQTYYVTAVNQLTGCVQVDSIKVKVNPLPRTNAGADQVVCTKEIITLGEAAVTGNVYLWQAGNGLSGANLAVANPSFQVLNATTAPAVYSYFLTVTSPSGCIDRDTVNVTVNPQIATNLPASTTVCSGQTAPLTNLSSVAGRTYQWFPADSLQDPTNLGTNVRYTLTGAVAQSFTYRLVTTITATGCKDTSFMVLNVNPLPVIEAGTGYNVCTTDSLQIGTLAAIVGQTYNWSIVAPVAGVTASIGSPTTAQPRFGATNTTGQPQRISLLLQSTITTTGCTTTDTTSVVVNPLPVAIANATPIATICSNGTAQLGAAPVAGFTYAWSPSTGLSSATVANPTVTLPNATQTVQSARYTLTVTNLTTNCFLTDTVRVIVNPLPLVNVGIVNTTCSNVAATIGAPAVAGYTYSWSPATGLSSSTVANPTVLVNNGGTAPQSINYRLVVTNATTGCKDSANLAFTVDPLPRTNAGADQVVCTKEVITLGEAAVTGNVYLWQAGNGLTGANLTVANPSFQVLNTTTAPAVYSYFLTVTSSNGCINRDTVSVTVNPKPNTVVNNLTLCSGIQAPIQSIVPVAGVTYQWLPADSLQDPTNPNSLVRRTIGTLTAQTYNYRLVNTVTATGCKDTSSMVLTINPLPRVNAGRNLLVCSKDSLVIGALSSLPGLTYRWTITSVLPVGVTATIGSPTLAQPNFGGINTTSTPQRIRLLLTVTNAATGCQATDTTNVLINTLPVAVANATRTTTICANGTTGLGQAPIAGFSYSWSPLVGLSSGTVSNPTISLSNPTQNVLRTRYTLTVRNLLTNCTNTDTVQVIVNPLPVVNVGTVSSACSNVPTTIGVAPVTGYAYQWTPNTGLSSSTAANPTVLVNNTGTTPILTTYKLVVTNVVTGCKDSSSLVFTVNPLPAAEAGANVVVCSRVPAQLGTTPVAGNIYSWSPAIGLSNINVANPTFTLGNTSGTAFTQQFVLTVTNASTGCVSTDNVTITLNPEPVTLRQSYDSTVCPQTASGRGYGVVGLSGSQYRWFVRGGTLLGGVQNGVLTNNNTVAVNWDTTATSFGLQVLEVSTTSCQADTVNFGIFYNSTTLSQIVVTQDPVLYDSALVVKYRVNQLGLLPSTARVRVFRRVAGSNDAFVLAGTASTSDTMFLDRPGQTSSLAYEYYVELDNLCGRTSSGGVAQSSLRLIGSGSNANQTSALTWNAYTGWTGGVERYEIYRKLDTELNWSSTPYATVAGSVTRWQAANGGDAFSQQYRIVAVKRNSSVRAQSNEVLLQFENKISEWNTITPNNDGKNDAFVVDNLELYGKYEIRIYNRHGLEIFTSADYRNDWNADGQPAGTYFYILKVEGARAQTLKGWIEVVK